MPGNIKESGLVSSSVIRKGDVLEKIILSMQTPQ